MDYITNEFYLDEITKKEILSLKCNFGFNGLSEVTFLRTYSREKEDGTKETWNEMVIRCTEGLYSIYIDYLIKNDLPYDEQELQKDARKYAFYMFNKFFLPSGRAMYSLGTLQVKTRGGACMYNCGAISTKEEGHLSNSVYWMCDMLFNGCGIGFTCDWDGDVVEPYTEYLTYYTVPDTKEGWSESIRLIVNAYTRGDDLPIFDYSEIREAGKRLKTFGGIAPGPKPLIECHKRIISYFEAYLDINCRGKDKLESFLKLAKDCDEHTKEKIIKNIDRKSYSKCRLICDIFNSCGVMISSGGIRRSAMLASAPIAMEDFIFFKNMEINPERSNICWMSNNSVIVEGHEDISILAENMLLNGEPGIINLANCRTYGRFGEESADPDVVTTNPCGEKPLGSADLCNLSEGYPSMCNFNELITTEAFKFATFTCVVISLLPTHIKKTNDIINKKRRIGVSLGGAAEIYEKLGEQFEIYCDKIYKIVRGYANELCDKLGVCRPIRVTTIEPSGTKSLVVGTTCGLHFPKFTMSSRRIAICKNSPICQELIDKGIPYEQSCTLENTWNFIFPIKYKTNRASDEISFKESVDIFLSAGRSYADSSVSVSLYFSKDKESDIIIDTIKKIVPKIKALSVYPHTPQGVYRQTPYCKANKIQYKLHKSLINRDTIIKKADTDPEKYCQGQSCEIRTFKKAKSSNSPSDTLLSLIRNPYDPTKDYTEINHMLRNKNRSLWPYPFLGLSPTDNYVYFAMLPINEANITKEVIANCDKYRLDVEWKEDNTRKVILKLL